MASLVDNDISNDSLLEIHLRNLLYDNYGCKSTHLPFNIRCNVCGDSKKDPRKKRGYFYKGPNEKLMYKCHDCGYGTYAEKWLKIYHPEIFHLYIKEILRDFGKSNRKLEIKSPIKEQNISDKYEQYFIPIKSDHKFCKDAIDYCQKRKIPEWVWDKWFVATKSKYWGRVIIPFYNKKGKVYFYQGRGLYDQTPKYLSKIGDKKLYNIYNIDINKPVLVTEGPINSIFLENSVATLGTESNKKQSKILEKLNCYYIFDNDDAGRKKAREFIKERKKVFLWKKTPWNETCNDINDIIMKENVVVLLFEELEQYFSKSVYEIGYI